MNESKWASTFFFAVFDLIDVEICGLAVRVHQHSLRNQIINGIVFPYTNLIALAFCVFICFFFTLNFFFFPFLERRRFQIREWDARTYVVISRLQDMIVKWIKWILWRNKHKRNSNVISFFVYFDWMVVKPYNSTAGSHFWVGLIRLTS